MTIHIGAKNDEIADTVLLPGDPMRAKWAAENFLTSPRLVNQVRGMLGFTGTFKGNRVRFRVAAWACRPFQYMLTNLYAIMMLRL